MADQAQDITVKGGFGQMSVKTDGFVEIEMTDNGGFTLKKDGEEVLSYTPPQATTGIEVDEKTAYNVGDMLPDGTIMAGMCPDTGKPIYVTARDETLVMEWREAMEMVAEKDEHGHQDWRLPRREELNVLFENREKGALKGTFNRTGSYTQGWYLSCTLHRFNAEDAWFQRFSDGHGRWHKKTSCASIRLVRS